MNKNACSTIDLSARRSAQIGIDMNITRVKALLKREMTDVLRDKKTLVMMVVVPIFLYPLLIIIMSLIMSAMTGSLGENTYKIAFAGMPRETASRIEDIVRSDNEDTQFEFTVTDAANVSSDLTEEKVNAVITMTGDKQYTVNYLSAKNKSGLAADIMMDALQSYMDELQLEIMRIQGLNEEELLHPIRFAAEDFSSEEEAFGSIMGGAIPVLMVISILLGAIYPAIDVTAGEKERGTLETLITLPVTNFEMIMSKFLAVAIVACTSAILNIASMGVALGFMASMMSEDMGMAGLQLSSFIPAVLVTVVVMLFFALFVTAVCLLVCLFAKSFKEANNYATPVMLVFMITSYLGMIPGLELNMITAGIPIINISLMVKQLFQMQYDYPLFGIVLLSNAVYSLLMIWLLGRVYNSEAVLFGEGFSGVKMFTRRSEMKKNQMPGYGDVILLICCVFLIMFYLGSIAQMKWGFGGVVVNQSIILVVTVFYAWYLKADWKKLFSVKAPKLRHIAGAAVLWAGLLCLMTAVVGILMPIMPESFKAVNDTFEPFTAQPFIVLWLVIALMPAVGEELLFRGFIFGTLKDKGKPITAMIVSSIIFALFHMSLIKFFTTFILGFFIVLAVNRTGSIFVGMLIHFINNTLSVISMKYADALVGITLLDTDEITLPQSLAFLAAGTVIVWLSFLLIGKEKKLLQKGL